MPPAELVGLTVVAVARRRSRSPRSMTARKATSSPNAITNGRRAARSPVPQGHQPGGHERRRARGVPAGHPGGRGRGRAALSGRLTGRFEDRLDDPGLGGGDVTVFPETAALGDPTCSEDPDELVGQEVESFDLGATARGHGHGRRYRAGRGHRRGAADVERGGRPRARRPTRARSTSVARRRPEGAMSLPGHGHRPPGRPAGPGRDREPRSSASHWPRRRRSSMGTATRTCRSGPTGSAPSRPSSRGSRSASIAGAGRDARHRASRSP